MGRRERREQLTELLGEDSPLLEAMQHPRGERPDGPDAPEVEGLTLDLIFRLVGDLPPGVTPRDEYDPDDATVTAIWLENARREKAAWAWDEFTLIPTIPPDFANEARAWAREQAGIEYVPAVVIAGWYASVSKRGLSTLAEWIANRGADRIKRMMRKSAEAMFNEMRRHFLESERDQRVVWRYEALRDRLIERACGGALDTEEAEEASHLIPQLVAAWDAARKRDLECRASGGWLIENPEEEDARVQGIAQLLQDLRAAAATRRRIDRIASQRIERAAPAPPSTTCAEPGCTKSRVFFDEDGLGYCKRHGNERGLRPHGKVT